MVKGIGQCTVPCLQALPNHTSVFALEIDSQGNVPSRVPSIITGTQSSHASALASPHSTSLGMQSSFVTGCEAVQPYETPRAAPQQALAQQAATAAQPVAPSGTTGASLYTKQVGGPLFQLCMTCNFANIHSQQSSNMTGIKYPSLL